MKNKKYFFIFIIIALSIIIPTFINIHKNKTAKAKTDYLNTLKSVAKENELSFNYNSNNDSIIISKNVKLTNGNIEDYLVDFATDEGIYEPKDFDKLRQSSLELCNSIKLMKDKFSKSIKINHIIINIIDTPSNELILSIDNNKLSYNFMDNVNIGHIIEVAKKQKEVNSDSLTANKNDSPISSPKKYYIAKFGEFLESNQNGNTLVVKFKISPSTSNKTTIDQNGYNVADLIQNQGADTYSEIQYWAIADMEDGSEKKVISFTLNKDLINAIKNKSIAENQIINSASDVWILPSLQQ